MSPDQVPALVVDWIACDGYGLCGDLAPHLVGLDDWRYPIIAPGPIDARDLDDARRIVDCCPMRALSLRRPDHRRQREAPRPSPILPVRADIAQR